MNTNLIEQMFVCSSKHKCTFATKIGYTESAFPKTLAAKKLKDLILWDCPDTMLGNNMLQVRFNGNLYYLIDVNFSSIDTPITKDVGYILRYMEWIISDDGKLSKLLDNSIIEGIALIDVLYSNPELIASAIVQGKL